MRCYCLQLSSEHFYLQKMTELALFIMYFCSWAELHTPLCRLLFPFFFFSLEKNCLSRPNANLPAKIFVCWMDVRTNVFSQASLLFFVSHSWLSRKVWQRNWHFVSQTRRILIAFDCIKQYRLTNAEARVWAHAFSVCCSKRPLSWQDMSE